MDDFSFNVILLFQPSEGKYSVNFSSIKHRAKLHFVKSCNSTKNFGSCYFQNSAKDSKNNMFDNTDVHCQEVNIYSNLRLEPTSKSYKQTIYVNFA